MRKFVLILFVSMSAVFAGCSRGDALPEKYTLMVSAEDQTKVSLDGGLNTVWNTGDQVEVFSDTIITRWTYCGEDGAKSGKIESSEAGVLYFEDPGSIVALYPFDEAASRAGMTLKTLLPSVQQYKDDSFSTTVMTAVLKDGLLAFRYACGYVCVSLNGTIDCNKAVLKGLGDENLAGKVSVVAKTKAPVLTIEDDAASKEIVMENIVNDGVSSRRLWFCLPPIVFKKGLVLELYAADGTRKEYEFPYEVEVGRAAAAMLEVCDINLDNTLDIMLDFRDGNQPFTEKYPTGINGKYNAATGYPEGKKFYTKDGNYGFDIYTCDVGAAGGYGTGYSSSNNYVVIGRESSYIATPAIPGYSLLSVEFQSGSTNGNPCITNVSNSKDYQSVRLENLEKDGIYNLYLSAREANKRYWFNITLGNFCFRYMKFTFVPEN